MTDLDVVVVHVIEKLEACGISYMIVGSHASNSYGFPRATHDADVVVEIGPQKINEFSAALGDEFYFDVVAAKEALKLGIMFNIIHYETGFKIDLIFLGDKAFNEQEFKRRRLASFVGRQCWFATPEDTILAKLEWSKKGDSERQFLDAVNVAKVQAKNLDFEYLRYWAADLQIEEQLNKLLEEIETLK